MNCTIVLPTFFPGPEIFDNLNSIPKDLKVLIIDNSYDDILERIACVFCEASDVLTPIKQEYSFRFG